MGGYYWVWDFFVGWGICFKIRHWWWVPNYEYTKTQWIVDFKRANILLCELYPNKAVIKKEHHRNYGYGRWSQNKGTDTSKNTEMETIVIHVREGSLDSGYGNGQKRLDCGNITEEESNTWGT